jgi:hypothetical protein
MFLRGEVERSGHDGICSYCGQHGRTLSIDKIADFVDPVLSEFFYPTEPKPGESRSVADVINDSAEIGPEAAEDIRRVLAERNTVIEEGVTGSSDSRFDPDAHYVMRESVDASDLEVDWRDFERSLKHENRYFNRPGETLLAFLFEGIDRHETIRRDPIVVAAGPGTKHAILYRARQCEGDAELRKAMERPDKEVGPPPVPSARANRMNAAGISVFYGATDPAVALAEVRPPVGSKVLIGCFEVTRPLRLLDFVALSNLADQRGSRFDSDYVRRLKRAEFLRKLGERISEPVMPALRANMSETLLDR